MNLTGFLKLLSTWEKTNVLLVVATVQNNRVSLNHKTIRYASVPISCSTDLTCGQTSVQVSLLLIKYKHPPNFRFQISWCIVNSVGVVGHVVVLLVVSPSDTLTWPLTFYESWETLCRISSKASVNRYVTLESGHRLIVNLYPYWGLRIDVVAYGYRFISVNLYTSIP